MRKWILIFIAVVGVVLTLTLTSFAVGFIDLTKIGASFSLDIFAISENEGINMQRAATNLAERRIESILKVKSTY